MAELIAVVGVAASVLNLIDGSCKFIEQIKQTRQLLQQQTGLEQLDDELATLAELLGQLQRDLEVGSVDQRDVDNVAKRVVVCVGTVEALRALLQKVSSHDEDSRSAKTGKFLLSVAKAKKVALLEKRIGTERKELQFVLQNVTRKSVSRSFEKLSISHQKMDGISVAVKQVEDGVEDIHQDVIKHTEHVHARLTDLGQTSDATKDTVRESHQILEEDRKVLAQVQQDIQDMPGEIILELARRPHLIRKQLESVEKIQSLERASSFAPDHTKNLMAFPRHVDRRQALRRYCDSRCPCSCHSQAKMSLVKGMSINSFGLRSLFWQQCDTPACRPARLASIDLRFFPQSILKFALRASLAFDYGAGGFSISPTLHLRRIYGWDEDLFVASRTGDISRVQHLIETGQASATDSDDIGWTAMHCAADNGHLEVAKYLAEKGGDLNEVTLYNESPTTLALRHIAKGSAKPGDRSACDIVQYFFDESDGFEHDSSLSTMSAYADLGLIVEKSFQLDRPKLRFQEKVDFRYDYGCTALAVAIILRDEKLAEEQISLGADARATNQWHQTILHLASRHGFFLDRLLETEAIKDLNARDDFNQTPLITAARNGSIGAVAKLLGVFPDAQCRSTGTSYNALHWAALSDHVDVVTAIAKYDTSSAHLDTMGWLGRTPILDAASRGNLDVLKALFEVGCNSKIRDSEGNMVLHLAGSAAAAQYLLSAGFDINVRGAKGRTPVMAAVMARNTEVVEFLVQAGADVALRDDVGWSALHYALQQMPHAPAPSSITELLKLCVRHGADPHAVDNCMCMCSPSGCSPTSFALLNGRIKQWMQVLEDLNLPKALMTRFIQKFRDFERLGKLHTCCQGSLFVMPYQHKEMNETEATLAAGQVEEIDEDDPENWEEAVEEEDEEVFHDAKEEPIAVESPLDSSLHKKIASMSRAGCQTILLSRGGKRMRVDVQSLIGFRDWEVLLDV